MLPSQLVCAYDKAPLHDSVLTLIFYTLISYADQVDRILILLYLSSIHVNT